MHQVERRGAVPEAEPPRELGRRPEGFGDETLARAVPAVAAAGATLGWHPASPPRGRQRPIVRGVREPAPRDTLGEVDDHVARRDFGERRRADEERDEHDGGAARHRRRR